MSINKRFIFVASFILAVVFTGVFWRVETGFVLVFGYVVGKKQILKKKML